MLNPNEPDFSQREQRQRSIRFLLMFLLMLTLMDGEDAQRKHNRLRKKASTPRVEKALIDARQAQDSMVRDLLPQHPRYQHLLTRNQRDWEMEVRAWAEQQPELQKDEFELQAKDPLETKLVYHYPWNVTGFYRGEWARNATTETATDTVTNKNSGIDTDSQTVTITTVDTTKATATDITKPSTSPPKPSEMKTVPISQVEATLKERLKQRNETIGVVLLPDQLQLQLPLPNNNTAESRKSPTLLRGAQPETPEHQITLTKSSGRAAFQLYSRRVPAIHELLIIDGFVKLYDSNTLGYSTRRDILLRVNGVLIPSLGLVSLVSSPSLARSALVMTDTQQQPKQQQQQQRRRRLQEAMNNPEPKIQQIRKDALELHPPSDSTVYTASIMTPSNTTIFPFPYVMDDAVSSVGRTRTPAARSMPPREQLLEANAGECEFEITLRIQEEEWTIGQWRALLAQQVKELGQLLTEAKPRKSPQDQALVMTLNGTIVSTNCDFDAKLNATAIRTDWEHTTGKAINYSFYMMLTCLTQIVLLLRQLLHTQAQSAAVRMSLLSVGWQTVLDALLCLIHIYLSLAMQPLFTAFASVAFFKLLIFCVIEMKYMAIIIQARNAGNNTLDLLRRQIAMLHLRFYVALLGTLLAFFYTWESHRTLYVLVLYSFWVPQIILNVITETRRPLHHYYLYGMSLTRLVAPLYVFAVPNNFLKEIYPDNPTNLFLCELLIVWVGIQAAILEAQGRYGARFMIPARFLPPKFDYNRPIPPSLFPAEVEDETSTPSEALHKERAPPPEAPASVIPTHDSPIPFRGARNRNKSCRPKNETALMTAETIQTTRVRPLPSFDCVICYTDIDIRNRGGYMLAPCDHLFHKDCLIQWMEVKMECPICRKDLPAL